MKIYAFHSYKGGSGRTLALANFALALKGSGKKVLMIDFDLNAPGLPYKFGKQNELTGGYINYLNATTPSDRAEGLNHGNRIRTLRDLLVSIEEDKLMLLPAGDPGRVEYWQHLDSRALHSLFSFVQTRPSPKGAAVTGHVNWRAFKRDIEDIKEAAGHPDYCLIDCKAANDMVAVPLLAWADHVVEFLHCNLESVFGTLTLIKHLNDSEYRPNKKVEFTPVVCRIPAGTSHARVESDILKLEKSFHRSYVSKVKFPIKDLQVLFEQREIEMGDILVLSREDSSKYTLAHSYRSLFRFLEGLGTDEEVALSKSLLRLRQQDEVVEKYFSFLHGIGELQNKDRKRNVALRKETIIGLLDSLAEGQEENLARQGLSEEDQKQAIVTAFENAGLRAGENFGSEAVTNSDVWPDSQIPKTILGRLQQWCAFDREAGFGDWSAQYDADTRQGEIVIGKNHFLDGAKGNLGLYFLRGYVRGVLVHLVGDVGKRATIVITHTSDTKFGFKCER